MKKILGIDVGGTKIAAGLVDGNFKLTQIKVLATSQTGLLKQISQIISSYKGFSGIALAMPGRVLGDGMMYSMANIRGFEPTNIKKFFSKFKVPVSVINDAKAFALAESQIGSGKGYNTVAGVVLGTGIGVGFVMNKRVYFGANSLAGEIGQFVMPDGQIFEQYVKKAGKFKSAKDAKKYLGLLLRFIIRSFDPELIVFGGGWSKLPGMQKVLNQELNLIYKRKLKTKAIVSKLSYPGIVGAVLAGLKK